MTQFVLLYSVTLHLLTSNLRSFAFQVVVERDLLFLLWLFFDCCCSGLMDYWLFFSSSPVSIRGLVGFYVRTWLIPSWLASLLFFFHKICLFPSPYGWEFLSSFAVHSFSLRIFLQCWLGCDELIALLILVLKCSVFSS